MRALPQDSSAESGARKGTWLQVGSSKAPSVSQDGGRHPRRTLRVHGQSRKCMEGKCQRGLWTWSCERSTLCVGQHICFCLKSSSAGGPRRERCLLVCGCMSCVQGRGSRRVHVPHSNNRDLPSTTRQGIIDLLTNVSVGIMVCRQRGFCNK